MISIAVLTIRERVRQLMWSVIGMVSLVAMLVAMWPSYRKVDISSVYGAMPESVQAMFGITGGQFTGMNYVNAELFSFMVPVVVIGIAIAAGNGAICGEESTGRMDLILSCGIRRHELVLGRVIGIAGELALIVASMGAALVVGDLMVDLDLEIDGLVAALLVSWLLGVLYAALAMAIACWTGRGGVAVGVAAAIGLTSWLLSSLGGIVPDLREVSHATAFYAYQYGPPILHGIDGVRVAQLAIEAAVLIGVAVMGFRRRDVG